MHAPLFRYFVICRENTALAAHPSYPRMGRTSSTTHPWIFHDMHLLPHFDDKLVHRVTDVTAVTRAHALLPCYTWAIRSLRGSISALVTTGQHSAAVSTGRRCCFSHYLTVLGTPQGSREVYVYIQFPPTTDISTSSQGASIYEHIPKR